MPTGTGGRLLANFAVVLVTLLLLVPVAEIVVRIAAPQTLPSQDFIRGFVLKDMYVNDAAAGYRLAPDFSGRIERNAIVTEFSTNSLGLRGEDLGEKTSPRVVAFGDSYTWGWGVGPGEEWIHVVGTELARDGGPRVETVNAGVNGYGTENALELLRSIGPELEPDLVLLGFFANDYTDNLLGAKGVYEVRDGYLFDHFTHDYFQESFLASHSHLFRLLSTAWETARVKYLGGVPSARAVRQFTPADFEKGRDLSERYIRAMDEVSRELGARFAVVWLPADVYTLGRRRPEDVPLRYELQQRIEAAGIPSVDLLPMVTQEHSPAGLYLPNDGHFSVRGNRVAGRAVARWIREEGLLPGTGTAE